MKAIVFLVFLATASADYVRRHMVFNHGERRHMVFNQGELNGVGISSEDSVITAKVDKTITDKTKTTTDYVGTVAGGSKDDVVCMVHIINYDFVGNSTDPAKNHLKIEYGYKFKGEQKEDKVEFGANHFVGAEGTAFSKHPFATVVSAKIKGEVKAESKGMKANEMNGMMAGVSSLLTVEIEAKLAKLDNVGVKASGNAGVSLEVAFKIDWTNGNMKIGGDAFVGAKGKVDFNMRWVVYSFKGYCGAGATAQIKKENGEAGFELGAALGVGTGVEVKICYSQIAKDIAYIAVRGPSKLKKLKESAVLKKFKDATEGKLKNLKVAYVDWKIIRSGAAGPNQLKAQKQAALDAKTTPKADAPKVAMKTLANKKSTMI